MKKAYFDYEQLKLRQKHGEESLQQLLLDHMPDPVWLKGLDGRYLIVNDAYAKISNFDKVTDIGKTDYELYTPEHAKQSLDEDATVRFDGSVLRVEREVSIAKGVQKKWYDIIKSPIFDAQGNMIAIAGSAREITDNRLRKEQLIHQNKLLAALQQISVDLMKRRDIAELLPDILRKAAQIVRFSFAFIYIFNQETGAMELRCQYGAKDVLPDYHNRGDAMVGHVWESRRILHIPDYSTWEHRIQDECFNDVHAAVGVPLFAGEKVIGVLCLGRLDPASMFSQEDLAVLDQFASLASVAVDNARLYVESIEKELEERKKTETVIRTAYDELDKTYDTTLEGWARALDLRDCETEGHSRRVASLSLQLARAMNVPEEELIHYWRGGLLHDVGKLGVPDSILLKPGKLTPEEWDIMRQHTVYGYEWLQQIDYLRPCLNIPLYHHERWDGTGYPKRLKGEEIPLEARIFAVVDVWDALCSDRPYRKRWCEEDVRKHIEAGAGNHFDPTVVEAFLNLPPVGLQSPETIRKPTGMANS